MTKYTDTNGLEWELKLTVGKLETLQTHGIDVEDIFSDPNKLADLFLAKPKKLCEMLYVMLEKQINERSITPEEFAESFDRETLDCATDAMITECVCFFQKGATAVAQEKVPSLLKEMDAKIQRQLRSRFDLASASLDGVTKSEELSESAPPG